MVQEESLNYKFTGVVLAGGRGKRLGLPKAFLKVNGQRVLDRILDQFSGIFLHSLVITGTYDIVIERQGVSTIKDIYPNLGPIGGLLTALKHADTEWVFMTGCDYPYLKGQLVELIVRKAIQNPDFDIVIPFLHGYYQVLHAAYRKSITQIVEKRIADGRYSIKSMLKFTTVRVLPVSEDEIREVDPEMSSFININTAEEFKKFGIQVI